MFPLFLGFGGGGSSAPSVQDTLNEIAPSFGPGGPYYSPVPAFPLGSVTTQQGGGYTGGQQTFYDFSKLQGKSLKNLFAGTGKISKKIPEEVRQDIIKQMHATAGGLVQMSPAAFKMLPKNVRSSIRKGHGISQGQAGQLVSEPKPAAAYDFLQNAYANQLQQQEMLNQSLLYPLFNKLAGFQGQAVGAAGDYLKGGFDETDPAVKARIDRAVNAYSTGATRNVERDYNKNVQATVAKLNALGFGAAGTSAAPGIFEESVNRPYAEALAGIGEQTEQMRNQMTNESLANLRAGYGAVLQSPQMNAAGQGFELPGLPMNPAMINPTGQWDPSLMANMFQYNAQHQLEQEKIKQAPGLQGIPSAVAAANQQVPNIGSSIGSAFGSYLPFAMMNNKPGGLGFWGNVSKFFGGFGGGSGGGGGSPGGGPNFNNPFSGPTNLVNPFKGPINYSFGMR